MRSIVIFLSYALCVLSTSSSSSSATTHPVWTQEFAEKVLSMLDVVSEEAKTMNPRELKQMKRSMLIAFDLEKTDFDRVEILTKMLKKQHKTIDEESLKISAQQMVSQSKIMESVALGIGGNGNVRKVVKTIFGAKFLLASQEERRKTFWRLVEKFNKARR